MISVLAQRARAVRWLAGLSGLSGSSEGISSPIILCSRRRDRPNEQVFVRRAQGRSTCAPPLREMSELGGIN